MNKKKLKVESQNLAQLTVTQEEIRSYLEDISGELAQLAEGTGLLRVACALRAARDIASLETRY